ncbi:MAG TPA: YcaO-like family protein [Opitutaceae bacterium]
MGRSILSAFGITRLARVTGLDRVGIPVWTAARPNAVSLSVSQGKGMDDDAAVASAIFEAVELAIAEQPHVAAFDATRAELADAGWRVMDCTRFLRRGESEPDSSERTSWVEGLDLMSGDAVFAPEDVVRMADTPGCRYWQSSDGLGTGSNLLEAAIHGVCELIERDAMALWSLRRDDEIGGREVAIADVGSHEIRITEEKIKAAGLCVRLFDVTSDTLVPAFLAVVVPADRSITGLNYLDLASGSGAHPVTTRAALRAITEAVQTRLTTITGSRDDVDPAEYRRTLPHDLRVYAETDGHRADTATVAGYGWERTLPGYLNWLVERLRAVGIRTLALVPFEVPEAPFAVARVIAPDLEQDPRSGNRRPGRRLVAAMLGGR